MLYQFYFYMAFLTLAFSLVSKAVSKDFTALKALLSRAFLPQSLHLALLGVHTLDTLPISWSLHYWVMYFTPSIWGGLWVTSIYCPALLWSPSNVNSTNITTNSIPFLNDLTQLFSNCSSIPQNDIELFKDTLSIFRMHCLILIPVLLVSFAISYCMYQLFKTRNWGLVQNTQTNTNQHQPEWGQTWFAILNETFTVVFKHPEIKSVLFINHVFLFCLAHVFSNHFSLSQTMT